MSTFLRQVTAGVRNGREWRGCWRHLCRRSLLNASGDVFVQPCVSSTRWHSLQNFILPPGCEKIFLHYVTDRILKLGFRPSLYWRSSLPFKSLPFKLVHKSMELQGVLLPNLKFIQVVCI